MKKLDWNSLNQVKLFKNGFKRLHPLIRVFGFLILEHIRGKQGEELLQQWIEIPIMQYFTREDLFHWDLPITNQEILMCKQQLSEEGEELLKSMIDEIKNI